MAAIGTVWATGSWVSVGGWAAGTWADAGAGPTIPYVADMNARLYVYLCAYYSVTSGDLTTMITRYTRAMTTGDATQRFQQMIQDATDAMP